MLGKLHGVMEQLSNFSANAKSLGDRVGKVDTLEEQVNTTVMGCTWQK